jgi:septum formation protein
MLTLASRSPRRAELLRAAGVSFRVVAPEGDDVPPPHARSFPRVVREMARRKAASVAARVSGLVLGADTIVVCEGRLLGKPANAARAEAMLRFLSGKRHYVYTGVALLSGAQELLGYERTAVTFRALSGPEIKRYVSTGEPLDKAGAYAIQGLGGALVGRVEGCYTNVVGLPLPRLLAMLAEFGGSG